MKAYSKISLKITAITIATWLAIATPLASTVSYFNGSLTDNPKHQLLAISLSIVLAVIAALLNKKLRVVSDIDFQRVIAEEKIDSFILKQFMETNKSKQSTYDVYQVLDMVQSNLAMQEVGKAA